LKRIVTKIGEEQRTIVKFLLVGAWNTVFGYLVYYAALQAISALRVSVNHAYLWAMGVAQVVGTINAYISHRKITFSESASENRINEFVKFSLIYILTFGIALILMPFFVEVLGVKAEITGIIVIIISTIVSYLGHSRFSFNSK